MSFDAAGWVRFLDLQYTDDIECDAVQPWRLARGQHDGWNLVGTARIVLATHAELDVKASSGFGSVGGEVVSSLAIRTTEHERTDALRAALARVRHNEDCPYFTRPCRIGPTAWDADILEDALRYCDDEVLDIGWATEPTKGESLVLHIVGTGWHLVVPPVESTPEVLVTRPFLVPSWR